VQDDHIRARVGQVELSGQKLIKAASPSSGPIGGHAVYLTPGLLSAIVQDQFPAQTLAALLYEDSGVRAMEGHRFGRTRLRHRRTSLSRPGTGSPNNSSARIHQAHMDVTAESVVAVYHDDHQHVACEWYTNLATCGSSRRGFLLSDPPAFGFGLGNALSPFGSRPEHACVSGLFAPNAHHSKRVARCGLCP